MSISNSRQTVESGSYATVILDHGKDGLSKLGFRKPSLIPSSPECNSAKQLLSVIDNRTCIFYENGGLDKSETA
jgi:hypothetical protein